MKMELIKYKITTEKAPGYMMVIYQDNHFKSVLNEFKPPLNEKQLNIILNLIPDDQKQLTALFKPYDGKITVTPVKAIGAEPALLPEGKDGAKDYPVNEKIALWCMYYAETHKDDAGAEVKYKTGPAEAGKLKALVVTRQEFDKLLEAYFRSAEWWSKPKSISNFINKYNEVRALVYTKAPVKVKAFPLPFDAIFFGNLSTTDQRLYWDHLRENGYKWVANPGRGGKWEKQH